MKKTKRRTFVLGDLHGAYLALKQVLERSDFDYDNDLLITIGDIVDGWEDSFMCVEELIKIRNRIDIIGNHDNFFLSFINSGIHDESWALGGLSTAKSYAKAAGFELKYHQKGLNFNGWPTYTVNLNNGDIPESHKKFFKGQHKYYKSLDNDIFVHGGFNNMKPIRSELSYNLMWDRRLWYNHLKIMGTTMKMLYSEEVNQIFIGHTSTRGDEPTHIDKLWNIDTGAGGGGKLTLMNIDNNEIFQSDNIPLLYPNDLHNKINFK